MGPKAYKEEDDGESRGHGESGDNATDLRHARIRRDLAGDVDQERSVLLVPDGIPPRTVLRGSIHADHQENTGMEVVNKIREFVVAFLLLYSKAGF